jgi:hypothetical protein
VVLPSSTAVEFNSLLQSEFGILWKLPCTKACERAPLREKEQPAPPAFANPWLKNGEGFVRRYAGEFASFFEP